MAAAAILQNKKSPYLSHGSSNFNEIWHDDAVQPSWLFRSLNIWNFKKSKMAMVANLKNRKIAISRPRFQQFQRNLARWCSSTLLTVLHRYKFENQYFSATVCLVGTAFGTMTHIGPPNQACYSRKFVRQFLCVNFAYANSHVRNAIHKTLLRTKNRKFVLKYAHYLSCRTTENFCKDSELMKLPQCLVLESQHKFVNGDACKM